MNIYESSEDYLERILMLTKKMGRVRSIDIALDMNYSKASISRAIKKLKEANYINVDSKGIISLTSEGATIASDILNRHTTLTNFFIKIGVNADIATNDACKVEHDLSPETFTALQNFLKKID